MGLFPTVPSMRALQLMRLDSLEGPVEGNEAEGR